MSSPALSELKSTLSGEIVGPGEEGYDYGIARWSDSCSKPATYVAFPRNAEDVAAVINFGRSEGLELAICGGGHSWSGASSTTGLVIHLGKYLNTTRCDPEERLLYVGGGALWETVDKAAYEHGLATVGGTVNHTGVGGLTLGGGYGWLSGRHGVTSDNLVQITVVLASGEIVTASETEHPDLFWGCGGSNFGVVTEFVLKAHPQRPAVFVTILNFPVRKLETFIEGVENWFETVTPDEACAFGFTQGGPQTSPDGPSIQMIYFYNGSSEDGRKAAEKLYNIGPTSEMPFNELPYVQLNSMMNQASAHGGRKYMKGVTVQPKLTLETAKALLATMNESVKDNPGFLVTGCQFEYVPKSAITSVPLESTAFTGRGTGRECLLFAMYTDPSLDTRARDTIRDWSHVLSERSTIATHGGKGDEAYVPSYTNYDPEPRSAALAFGSNYNRLREVKRRYDPENVWRKWYPIEPAPLTA
ncbi:hypothetical protein FS837_000588 [Tulasnella sp. UAMH 9824]|nr:hypothetical protein FS837_000588 [Tulasnella sp. UAMH 9824]